VKVFHEASFQSLFDENGGLRVRRDSLLNDNLDRDKDNSSFPKEKNVGYAPDIAAEVERIQTVLCSESGETRMDAVTRYLSKSSSTFPYALHD
jgi:hypothetical protein